MDAVRQAVIMVGGKGTRLAPLTDNTPKPALPVLDMPCLKYLIRSMVQAGIQDVILACGYRSDDLRREIGDGSDLGITIRYSDESEPLGTGGAMKKVEDWLDDTFVAANGDVFADIDMMDQIVKHRETGAAITILMTHVENPCEYGIARVDESGRIHEFKDKPRPEEVFSDLINAGVYVVDKKVLDYVPSGFYDFSKDLIPKILKEHPDMRVQGCVINGRWRDVGRPSDLLGANLDMAKLTHIWHNRNEVVDSDIIEPFFIESNSKVENSSVRASVILGFSHVKDSKLIRSLIMQGCTVRGARVENSILGKRCVVMPGAIVFGAVLSDDTVVEADEHIYGDRL